jgi:hypothetical protein
MAVKSKVSVTAIFSNEVFNQPEFQTQGPLSTGVRKFDLRMQGRADARKTKEIFVVALRKGRVFRERWFDCIAALISQPRLHRSHLPSL